MPPVPIAAKIFAAFAFILALIALLTFWPPTTADVTIWLLVWIALCAATGVAILRRHRYATSLVWTLLGMALLSAGTALRSGMLDAAGIAIDIALFAPLIWFAIWYQRSRRAARDRER